MSDIICFGFKICVPNLFFNKPFKKECIFKRWDYYVTTYFAEQLYIINPQVILKF